MKKRLRDDVEQHIGQFFAMEAATCVKLPVDQFKKRLDELSALRERLKDYLLKVEVCTTSEQILSQPEIQNHHEQSVEQVLRTIRDANWGSYGPSFPFQMDRYRGLLELKTVHIDDPILGACHSFEITLTEAGLQRIALEEKK